VIAPIGIQEGIYLNMPFNEYLAIPALSHSGMKDMRISQLEFWHRNINPNRTLDESTSFTEFGTALHSLLLEPDEHCTRYYRALDKADYPDALFTMDDLKDYCAKNGLPTSAKKKADLIDRVREHSTDVVIWDELEETHALEHAGQIELSPYDADRLADIHQIVSADAECQRLLTGGHSEVTIVVRDPVHDVLLKCRHDYMRPRATTDIKTFTNSKRKPIRQAVYDEMFYRGYLTQAVFYHRCRTLAEGLRVHGGNLDRVRFDSHDFTFLFIESEAPHHIVPVTLRESESDIYWQEPKAFVEQCIEDYAENLELYGTKPWRERTEAHVLEDHDIRQLAFS
jgi:hypothetical protein